RRVDLRERDLVELPAVGPRPGAPALPAVARPDAGLRPPEDLAARLGPVPGIGPREQDAELRERDHDLEAGDAGAADEGVGIEADVDRGVLARLRLLPPLDAAERARRRAVTAVPRQVPLGDREAGALL